MERSATASGAPAIASGSLFVRSRTAIHCVPLSELQTNEPLRNGTAVTSMDAMYGAPLKILKLFGGKASFGD